MIEVEVKLPVSGLEKVRRILTGEGFTRKHFLREEDHYFDLADGQIRKRGEAIRIRKTTDLLSGETESLVTFKGKKTDKVSMTRKELETGIQDADVMHGILEALDYQEVPPAVIKKRDELSRGEMNACLDEVEGLGSFLELEIVLDESDDQEAALGKIREVLKKLGYDLTDTIRTSYLTLLQRKMEEKQQ